MQIKLLNYQKQILEELSTKDKCAIYTGCGTGKTFMGSEKFVTFKTERKLIVCQASKVSDWKKHMELFYGIKCKELKNFDSPFEEGYTICTYGLLSKRNSLKKHPLAILIDESSKVQHRTTMLWSKGLGHMKIKECILLSGTPITGNHWENLWTQLHILGYPNSYKAYLDDNIDYMLTHRYGTNIPYYEYNGAKDIHQLKKLCESYGCVFRKTEDLIELPDFNEITHSIKCSNAYKVFSRTRVVQMPSTHQKKDKITITGDSPLNQMNGGRLICGICQDKVRATIDMIDSIGSRCIVFYNFQEELDGVLKAQNNFLRPVSIVNGTTRDLEAYENEDNSVTFVQYQAGAHGLNLQKANEMIFMSPPLSCELFAQAQGRIRRLGQEQKCFYHYIVMSESIETQIYLNLFDGIDYNLKIFEEQWEAGII